MHWESVDSFESAKIFFENFVTEETIKKILLSAYQDVSFTSPSQVIRHLSNLYENEFSYISILPLLTTAKSQNIILCSQNTLHKVVAGADGIITYYKQVNFNQPASKANLVVDRKVKLSSLESVELTKAETFYSIDIFNEGLMVSLYEKSCSDYVLKYDIASMRLHHAFSTSMKASRDHFAAKIIRNTRPPNSLELLRKLMTNHVPYVRWEAFTSFAELGCEEEALSYLKHFLNDEDQSVRRAAELTYCDFMEEK